MVRHARRFAAGRNNRNFARDTRGNVAIIFALLLVPVIVLMGLGVDGFRALNAAETAHDALDAAALAAARAMTTGNLDDDELTEVARNYFRANVVGAGKVPYSTYEGLEVAPDRSQGAVTVSVTARVPTTFGQLAHVDELTMRRSSTAVTGRSDIELGLMLDVTGSMNERGKLRALKRAAGDMIDTLIPEDGNAGRVRIGLAPYSASVNAGRYASTVSGDESHDGCVVNREGRSIDADTAPRRGAWFRSIEQANASIERDDTHGRNRRGYDFYECPNAEVQPLTSDKALLRSTVERYRARGRTAGHLGIAWAWYLLAPDWGSVWGNSAGRPYGSDKLIKAMVLMTDGEFNAAYAGSDVRPDTDRESYHRAENLCDNAKRDGVIIFSVAFDLRERSAERALADCASSSELFFRAENEEELRRAYRNIAIKLTELRIAK